MAFARVAVGGGSIKYNYDIIRGGHVSQFIFSPITLYGLICKSQLGGGLSNTIMTSKGGGAWISINFLT